MALTIVLVASVVTCAGKHDSRSADEVLQAMAARYSRAAVYRDSGVVQFGENAGWEVLGTFLGRAPAPRAFTTAFHRANGSITLVMGRVRIESRVETAEKLLIDAAPGTSGVSTFAPLLLLGTARQFPGATRLPDTRVHGVSCYAVRFPSESGVETTIFVEQERLLIRRIRRVFPVNGRQVTRTLNYREVHLG
ncbi:MAG TPA: hypothetical protein VF698_10325 [Thermoanaerobaculia bacterium]